VAEGLNITQNILLSWLEFTIFFAKKIEGAECVTAIKSVIYVIAHGKSAKVYKILTY